MRIDYLKMEGAGNRILIVDQRATNVAPPERAAIAKWGNEQPGFDQLMWINTAAADEHAASYRVFNADGSEVQQCGNGVRCVAWALARIPGSPSDMVLESPSGPIEAHVLDRDHVAVSMGAPDFTPARIPFVADSEAISYSLDLDGTQQPIAAVSMGNPHCVLRVDTVADADVETIGSQIQRHRRFPESVNVGFMAIKSRDAIDLRVFERGVGETLACGTGACAAVVAAIRSGDLDNKVDVSMPGGRLVVSWRGVGEPVWLTGDATFMSEGSIDL